MPYIPNPAYINGNLTATGTIQGAYLTTGTLSQKGSQRLTMAGAAQSATIVANTSMVRLAAEFGDLRYDLLTTATATSCGYLPAGTVETLWLTSSSTLSIYGAIGTFANLLYF